MLLGRVGGRLDSVELKTENGIDRWDVGGQWICRQVIYAAYHHIDICMPIFFYFNLNLKPLLDCFTKHWLPSQILNTWKTES